MNVESTQWIFNASTGMIITGGILFLIYLFISAYHLKQTHFTPMRLLTEGLKLVGAVFLFMTLGGLVYTAGGVKSQLDPFQPEKPEDIERLHALQDDIHGQFKDWVRARRGKEQKNEGRHGARASKQSHGNLQYAEEIMPGVRGVN